MFLVVNYFLQASEDTYAEENMKTANESERPQGVFDTLQ